jgi:Transposase
VCLVKRRWACENGECPRVTFTESLPQLPPRCKITRRHDDIPELISLAKTISRWEDQIVCAVITGVTNASESLNRLAKLEARQACELRNPASQRRRVRIACTRGTRRKTRAVTRKPARTVIPGHAPPG